MFVTQTHHVWGGMEQWLHHFSLWLKDRGWSVRAALPRGDHNDASKYLREHPHLESVVLDVRAGGERLRAELLSRAILTTRADIVIPIGSGAVFAAAALARSRGSSARLLVPIRSLHPDLFCNVADFAPVVDGVVAVSRLIEALAVEVLPADRRRVHYIRHGSAPARRPRNERAGPLRLGFVGRLEESTKRVLDIPRLASELRRRNVPAEIHVLGAGPDESAVRAALEACGGVPVHLHGARTQEELYDSGYPNLDILLLFSPAEGSPNAVYEAMQHGVVPVVSRYLGLRQEGIVRHEETGQVFPVGDMAAAADAIGRLAGDSTLLELLSRSAAREVAHDTRERMHLDWERILQETLVLPLRTLPDRWPALKLPPAGRLDRLLPVSVAAALRRATGRFQAAGDGWSEWPGTAAAAPECIDWVLKRLREIDSGSPSPDVPSGR